MKHQRIDELNTVGVQIKTQARSSAAPYAVSPNERAAVRAALACAQRGGFADEADVDATLRRPWG